MTVPVEILATRAGVLRYPNEAAEMIAERLLTRNAPLGVLGLDGSGNIQPNFATEQPNIIHTILSPTPDQLLGGFPTKNAGVSTPELSTEQAFTFRQTIKITITASGNQGLYWLNGPKPSFDVDGTTPIQTTMPIRKFSEICVRFYCADVSDLTSVNLYIYTDAAKTAGLRWIRGSSDLVDGWNTLRFVANTGTTGSWDGIYRLDFLPITSGTGPTVIYIDHIWGVERPKTSIVFVDDFALRWFMDGTNPQGGITGGYPDLKERGLPCVFASQPRHWGADSTRPTAVEVLALSKENGNEISFHSFGGEGQSLSALTTDEVQSYASKAIRTIKEAGIRWFPWRAAWLGNTEDSFAGANTILDGLFYAIATAEGDAGLMSDPHWDLRNIPRYAIHNRTEEQLNTAFADLDKFHPTVVHYTHYVADDFAVNIATERWEQYLALVDERLAAGTLEFITMETVFRRNGGRLVNTGGQQYWEWTESDADETVRRIRI